MVLTFGKRYDSTDDVMMLCDTYDGQKDPHGYDFGYSTHQTDAVRTATDPVWADYLIRQGHARVVRQAPAMATWRVNADPTYDVEVEPQWMRYFIVRAADGMPIDPDKTFAEQGLTDTKLRVRMSCMVEE